MKRNRLFIIVTVLTIITVLAAVVHLSTREEIGKEFIKLTVKGEERLIPLSELTWENLKGIRLNGKGEKILVEGNGIQMKNLLRDDMRENIEIVRILADDSYEASVKPEEIKEENKVCLFLEKDGTVRLVVFGDENSKRSVSDVVAIIIE